MTSLDELASHSPVRSHLAPDDDDGDTASQRSISLSSPAVSARNSVQAGHSELLAQLRQPPLDDITSTSQFDDHEDSELVASESFAKRESRPYTVDTEFSSEADDLSYSSRDKAASESPNTSAAPSVFEESVSSPTLSPPATYPPRKHSDAESLAESFVSERSSKKARPESILVHFPLGKLVLGIALIDFNHLVGPKIEWSKGEIFNDEEVIKMLPFLALPDGAHLSAEDYSYFHVVPSGPNPSTVFGISCNQQIAASALLVKMPDVTRSTVQKAVVVLASKPVFGPIRDKLGVVTTALFHQRDFTDTQVLDDFESGLEVSLRTQLTESGLYMGTSLRELVHTFRQRTLILVKALILQKRIMFYGHPVERLCTYQYSLVSLLPGLLQTLDDCGSPPLNARAPTLSRPSSLRTSDRKSMMAYTGLPLDVFGKDAFFQPYLPLQQLDMLKETKSWLCGSTNSIVTQQKEVDLMVNIETGVFEFRDAKLERSAGLTPADRKWMDDIVKDVNDGWNDEDPTQSTGISFKGSDDYLRTKFDEYISAALASVRYRDFLAKGEGSGVLITGGTGAEANSPEDFNLLWISEFKNTNAYEVWERTTDPMLFDIVEPRHPCNEKVSVVMDIGLRLQEGIQELKLDQQLAPAREAVSRTFSAGSTGFFKAVEGVRERWQRASASTTPVTPAFPANPPSSRGSEEPEIVNKTELESSTSSLASVGSASPTTWNNKHASVGSTKSVASGSSDQAPGSPLPSTRLTSWGSGIGSFMSSRFSMSRSSSGSTPPPPPAPLNVPSMPSTPPQPTAKVAIEPPTPTARDIAPHVSSPTSPPTGHTEFVASPVDVISHTMGPQSTIHEDSETHVIHNESDDEADEAYSVMAL